MDEYSLPVAISALADSIAAQTPDNLELAVLAAAFTQLGDSLATIITVRELTERNRKCRSNGGRQG